MKFKKSIAMAMSVFMAAGMLVGCGKSSDGNASASGSTSSASGEVSTDGVTISVFDKTQEVIHLTIR